MNESPNIIQVKNDVVRIQLPQIEQSPSTNLVADYAAGVTAITVADNSGFAQNDYIIIGSFGQERAEIVKINAAVTSGAALTITGTTFAHNANSKVTLIRYNQVAIYGAATSTSTNPTIIGSLTNIDVSNGFNEIKAGTTYAYYYAKFYNAQTTTYSELSAATANTGYARNSVAKMKEAFLRYVKENLSPNGLTQECILEWLNDWQDDVQDKRKYWDFTRTVNDTWKTTIEDQMRYELPDDIQDSDTNQSILKVWVKNYMPLKDASLAFWDALNRTTIKTTLAADVAVIDTTVTLTSAGDFDTTGSVDIQGDTISYTGKTGNTLTGITGITAVHSTGDEVHQSTSTGNPLYYRINDGYLELYPIPDSSYAGYNIHLDYIKVLPILTADSDTTLIPFYNSSKYYLAWQWYENKNAELAERNRKLYEGQIADAISKLPLPETLNFRPGFSDTSWYTKKEFDQTNLGWRNR